MNQRTLLILGVLLLVLGGGALLMRQQDSARQASNVATLGQPVLPELKAADVASIRITAPGATMTVALKDGVWRIAERGGFPADLDKVRALLIAAVGLRIGQSEPIGAKDRARVQLAETGDGAATVLEFGAADGRTLARLLIGKTYFRSESGGAAKGGDGRFVMLPARTDTVYVVSDPLTQANTRSADWIDRRGFAAERVRTLEVRHADGDTWRVSRPNESTDWALAELKDGEKLEVTRANAATYSMSLMKISDVAAAGTETGLDKPDAVVTATTFDGLTYTLRVGRQAGDARYASVAISGEISRERTTNAGEKPDDKARRDKEHAGHLARLEERLPRERALGAHTLLITNVNLDDVMKKRKDLLAAAEEKK